MRSDKAPIIRINLNKPDSEILKVANLLGIETSDILHDKAKFKTLYFILDNDLQYRAFAFIRRSGNRMEYSISMDNYLKSIQDTDINSIEEIKETFDRINNNTKYLLGEEVDNPDAIKNETHLNGLTIKMDGDKDSAKKKSKKVVNKENTKPEDNVVLTLDEILDKISKTGIKSLTKSEKSLLDGYSKK